MKQKIILKFFLITAFLIINSCTEFKRAVTNTKKPAGDEFLVEKKEPLTLPPNFDELPVPLSEEKDAEINSTTEIDIESLLSKTSQTDDRNKENLSEDLEVSILEKINNAN